MYELAIWLQYRGWTLRSGGAEGADTAFEQGADWAGYGRSPTKKEIFLPWKNFNKNPSPLYPPSSEAMEIASKVHPAWEACSRGARLLHARNIHQVLGQDLKTPVEMVVCWTMGGGERGGTATAMKVAKANGARIYNLYEGNTWWDEMIAFAG